MSKIDVSHIQRCIKNQELSVRRLTKCLQLAIDDNGGDKFRINRLLVKHQAILVDLKKKLGEAIQHAQYLEGVRLGEDRKAEEAAIRRLRIEIANFDFESGGIHV